MKRFAIYGKGGSGKSTITSNLSVQMSRRGLKTIQIGCDPKHDSTRTLTGGRRIPSVMDLLQKSPKGSRSDIPPEAFLFEGIEGIGCIETGGPESGVGCAGLGIVSAFNVIHNKKILDNYEVVFMDVLGDVVCGGFAMPLMKGLAGAVAVVISDTLMSMYAANNISRAIRRYQRNGTVLAGLIVNNMVTPDGANDIARFADRLGTVVLGEFPRDKAFIKAERKGMPVSELYPDGELSVRFSELADRLLRVVPSNCPPPNPMTDDEWDEFVREMV